MTLVLLIFAFVLFVLAAVPFAPVEPWRFKLVAAGLACWVASLIPIFR